MDFFDKVEKDVKSVKTWIINAAEKVSHIITDADSDAKKIAPQLSEVVDATQSFLAATTPAIEQDGLNLPADSVAYAKLLALIDAWQQLGSTVLADIKALEK